MGKRPQIGSRMELVFTTKGRVFMRTSNPPRWQRKFAWLRKRSQIWAFGLVSFGLLSFALQAQTNCFPAPTGLVSWWSAEGNANDSVDSNNGVLQGGTTFAPGEVGQAFNFNGTSAFVQVADAPSLRFTNAMTVEAWIYPRRAGGSYREIMAKWEGGGQRSFVFDVGPDGRVEIAVNSDGGVNNIASAFSLNPVPSNYWTHVAGVYDGATVKLYLNGILQSSTPWTQGIFPGSAPLIIGATLSSGSFFDGLIDEPSVYNRALSTGEIAAIYNAGSAGKCPTGPP